MPPITSPRPPGRVRSLDGLRGVAALVVLVHHCSLLFPSLAAVYYADDSRPPLSPFGLALSYTPLHLLRAGTESVYLFFVLSGLVLVRPVLARPDFDWVAYYPRRLVRLYGPVVVAVALGLGSYALAPRVNDPALGPWVVSRPNTYPGGAVLTDVTLVTGHSSRISPLWSLQWEVLFSLLLPLFVLATVGRRLAVLRALLALGLIAVGAQLGLQTLFYLPMFAIGALTAVHWTSLQEQFRLWSRWRPFPALLVVTGVLLTCIRWESTGLGASPVTAGKLAFLAVPGVWLLVVTAAFWPPLRDRLHSPFLQWAGRVSFSLYLVHEPVVLGSRFLTAGSSPWLSILLAVPVAVVLAVAFERYVEARFHRLAQQVGRRVQHRHEVRAAA